MTQDHKAVLEAERLHKLATPGEWSALPEHRAYGYQRPRSNQPVTWAVIETLEDDPPLAVFGPHGPETDNAKAVASLHNIAPVLFSAYHREKGLREALKKITTAVKSRIAALNTKRGREKLALGFNWDGPGRHHHDGQHASLQLLSDWIEEECTALSVKERGDG